MRNWAKWHEAKARRSAAGRAGANARWAAYHATQDAEPVRQSRVTEIVIRDSHRPMEVIRLTREPRGQTWSRAIVTQNNQPVGRRAFGVSAISRLLARSLQ
jgi:hypothetical protein